MKDHTERFRLVGGGSSRGGHRVYGDESAGVEGILELSMATDTVREEEHITGRYTQGRGGGEAVSG